MKTTLKLILTSLTGVMLVGTSNAEITAAMLEKGCVNKGDFWVIGADNRGACVPKDPCSSEDANIRESFCVQSVTGVPLDVDGYEAYTYSLDKKSCSYQKFTKGANDPVGSFDTKLVKLSDCTGEAVQNKGKYEGIVHNDLEPGGWVTRFYYADIKGRSMCSGQSGHEYDERDGNSKDWLASEETLKTATGEKANCWCIADGLWASGGIGMKNLSLNVSWVLTSKTTASDCASSCAYRCGGTMLHNKTFRSAVLFNK